MIISSVRYRHSSFYTEGLSKRRALNSCFGNMVEDTMTQVQFIYPPEEHIKPHSHKDRRKTKRNKRVQGPSCTASRNGYSGIYDPIYSTFEPSANLRERMILREL